MRGFRWASRLIIVFVIMILTGCDIGVPGRPKPTPTPLPADQAVFQVEAYGGLVPPSSPHSPVPLSWSTATGG